MRFEYCFCTCDFAAGALGVLLACYFVLKACDLLGRSCGSALRILLFVLETCKPRAGTAEAHFAYTFALRRCDIAAGALGMLFAYYFHN